MLYFFIIGSLLVAGYLGRTHHIVLLILKAVPRLHLWLGAIWGRKQKVWAVSPSAFNLNEKSKVVSDYSSHWWEDDELFQLEKRAIFSKTWLFVTHACRFQKPGDYRTFEIAGFSIIVILGKDKKLRSFQNICRHRAYQVTKKECGRSTVLGCRYHGWSYDTRGELVKAPEFETVPGFDKSKNALWEVKTKLINSLVFVNFEATEQVPNLEFGKPIRELEAWNMKDIRCATEWKVEGTFNWKLAAGDFPLTSSSHWSTMCSILPPVFGNRQKGEALGYAATIRPLPSGDLLTIRFLPKSPNITTIHCCIYTRQGSDAKVERRNLIAKKELRLQVTQMENKQTRILDGEYTFSRRKQDELRDLLKVHGDSERRKGMEIHPAAQKGIFTLEGKADDDFCRELDASPNMSVCGANAKGILDW
ncbi:2-aminobenzenesulfonate 2,3-dioxygenase subunit alpha [Lachnellula suecica]|uniref:2-aminobenzenesulfonate 2,3-dioxygenase subunit alpha n=1 Tax=Lachnellula suecica TaxID=602035 RepID=A0A8T9CK71_9HELO|nr:2-aminobenzenesulfonate 2,3-dioxygenase subunit alpha [Lachnellula suecica]